MAEGRLIISNTTPVINLAPLIEKLRISARFWISLELESRVLNDVGEFRL